MRLDDDTPAKKAVEEFLKAEKRKPGRPNSTWMKQIQEDLSESNVQLNIYKNKPQQTLDTLKHYASDRSLWKKQIRVVMDDNHPKAQ